jgi:hypothetical protein
MTFDENLGPGHQHITGNQEEIDKPAARAGYRPETSARNPDKTLAYSSGASMQGT